ncbi:MAG: thiamine phosphate synthase [Deltaproteobacteria bacterium]|jgi:thiamine-phosphate pyrophosphorylase|nr:thiamine phosphate synthase [Deltaproteobacteria bacterium]
MKKILPQTDLYGILDYGLSRGRSNIEVAARMLEAGIKIIQYREKDRKMGVIFEECKAIRALTREAGAVFIINDFADIVNLTDADGLHIGQEDLPVPAARSLIGPARILGLSTHSPAQADAAVEAGADYIGVGPLFFTKTKKDVCQPVGLEYLDYVVKTHNIPFVAIGGIKTGNIREVAAHGAGLCCLVSEIVGADDIGAAINEIRRAMRR